jgi:hypothetical protein
MNHSEVEGWRDVERRQGREGQVDHGGPLDATIE